MLATATRNTAHSTAAAQAATGHAPSLHHRALYTWLSVYCMITSVQLILGPSLIHLPLEVRTLILTGIVVPVVVYLLVPALVRLHAATTRRIG
jgi:antibiotic biosynthesis monooxygenase (ABM) superfamily enzyme